jgi:putative effector of murein hydrolase LrgA (UPF0299 family)
LESTQLVDAPRAYASQIRLLYRVAMLVFLITVGIGILNGLDLVDFDRWTILTHVHAGTLGWITLSIFGISLWLMAGPGGESRLGRGSVILAAIGVPLYVLAFWTGRPVPMAIAGTAVLFAVYAFTWLAIVAYRSSARRPPQLAAAAGLTTLSIGSTIGVLIQLERAIGHSFLPADAIGGHAGAQIVGYLVLTGMAIAEWRLLPDAPRTRSATWQVGLLFAGGLLTSIGALTGSEPLLGVSIPLELAALAIFLIRIVPRLRRVRWLERGSERQFAIMAPFLVANVLLLIVLIAGVVSGKYADFGAIPPWIIFAFDHAMFIGVMTNGLLGVGMLLAASGGGDGASR